ncbi:hypothetical protein [Bacillus sp. FSL L8-0654]|uniref:hypothetical protein n=1 Tax=Bacillus sp. FSL L8-0654 TaxID=2921526 RepID=UPI003159CDEE
MNKTNETREIKPFGQVRDVLIYLSRFGKNMYKANIDQQTEFKEKVKQLHDVKKIKILLKRLEEGIDNQKSSSHFTAAFFVILSFTLGNMLNYFLGWVDILEDATVLIIMVFYVALAIWGYLSWSHSNTLKKSNRYITLLQECVDEISEKKSKRRFLKLTNKYRTP